VVGKTQDGLHAGQLPDSVTGLEKFIQAGPIQSAPLTFIGEGLRARASRQCGRNVPHSGKIRALVGILWILLLTVTSINVESLMGAIMAVGMTAVIISGGIDLSVGSIMGLAALACAAVSQNLGENAPPWVAVPVGRRARGAQTLAVGGSY